MKRTNVIRMAMPVNLSPGTQESLLDEGWIFEPSGANTPPDVTITNLKKLDPETDISIPKLIKVKTSDIRKINGQDYIISVIEPPKDYKRVTKSVSARVKERLSDNGDGTFHYPGFIRAFNLSTKDWEEFDAEPVLPIIREQSQKLSEESRQRINAEIKNHNARIDQIDAASADLTRLPLQLARVRTFLSERLGDLNGIITSTQEALTQAEQNPPPSIAKLDQDVESGMSQFEGNDLIDHILTHYIYNYNGLVTDLNDETHPLRQRLESIPQGPDLIQRLLTIGQHSFDSYMDAKKKKALKPAAPTEPFDISQFPAEPIGDIPEGGTPFSDKATAFSGWKSYIGSLKNTIKSREVDQKSLTEIDSAINEVTAFIGSMPEGTRGASGMKNTPEGQKAVALLRDLFNEKIGNFAGRYKKVIVDGGSLDTSKMGRGGQIGNALLIPVFARIYGVVNAVLAKAGLTLSPVGNTLEEVVEAAPEVPTAPAASDDSPVNDNLLNSLMGDDSSSDEFNLNAGARQISLTKSMWTEAGRKAGWIK